MSEPKVYEVEPHHGFKVVHQWEGEPGVVYLLDEYNGVCRADGKAISPDHKGRWDSDDATLAVTDNTTRELARLAAQLAAVQGELAEARKALATVDDYSDVSNIFGALLDSDASGLYAHLCDQIALARGAAQV